MTTFSSLMHLKRAPYPESALKYYEALGNMLTCGALDVSKAREQQRGRPAPIRPLVQGYIGEASGSDTGSDVVEDFHPLKGQVTQLDDYWASERDPGFTGSSLPPTTAFSPAQLLALAESTAGFDELSLGQQSSVASPASSSYTIEAKDFSKGTTQTRPRRSRFQRGCRTCRSVRRNP
jgi:hypothetical protein